MFNLVEMIDEDQHQSPCKYGNIVDGHACYCHADSDETSSKCHIWRNYEEELIHWHKCKESIWSDDHKSGCMLFEEVNKGE